MGAVGEAVAGDRQVWTNDAQAFASTVGKCVFTSQALPLGAVAAADKYFSAYNNHQNKLAEKTYRSLALEQMALHANSFEEFSIHRSYLPEEIVAEVSKLECNKDFDLFTQLYADTYFGLSQSIEIDAIICSIVQCSELPDERNWCIVALGRAMLRCSNSTGHFAQFLVPKAMSYKTFQRQRRRRIWDDWLTALDSITPAGSKAWRAKNRSFNEDAIGLLTRLQLDRHQPSVVYADPPYTNDQYSRFYHILETLILYDYPEVSGRGRYRQGRFSTSFSLKTKAVDALDQLAASVAALGAELVLSYPTNGLIYDAGGDPLTTISKHFGAVERAETRAHFHSTLGGSKGIVRSEVVEQIFWAR